MAIPALLSKKAGAPVMMRVSREEESYFGRARTSMVGRAKMGFAKDGRITALDLFIVQDGGPYGPMGDHRSAGLAASLVYQPGAMRWRAVNVLTNTPPRSQQRSPGPMQANGIIEPVVTKAARQLGLDQVAIRRLNSPEGKAPLRPGRAERAATLRDRRVREGGARSRRRALRLADARRPIGSAPRHQGARRRGHRRAARLGIGGLRRPDDDPARRPALRAVRGRQPRHALGDRSRARRRRRARDAVGEGRGRVGQHRQRACRGRASRSAHRRRTR